MLQTKIAKFLEKLGLSKTETAFYLAILELGISSVPEISKRAEIDRVTGYKVMDSLIRKGLIELLINKKRGKAIKALSPVKIKELVQRKKLQARKLELGMEDIIPQLKTIYKSGKEKPEIYFYEGLEGIKKVFEDTLTSSEEIIAYAGGKTAYDTLGDFIKHYFERRAEAGISIKVIMPDTPQAREIQSNDKKHLRESAIVNSPFDFGLEVNVYDDKVALMEFEQRFGMIIKSSAFAKAQKEIFKLAWERAKEKRDNG